LNDQPSDTGKQPFEGVLLLDEQVGYLLRLANQRHSAIFQNNAPLGLTPTQFATIVRLSQLGECSQNFLGRETAMDVATIKGVVDRLHKKGLIVLKRDPDDRRRVIVAIAPAHVSMIADLHASGHDISRATLGPLDADEQETFLRLLKKIT
jgi:DNA-binding MarR family transcriptional regulator